MEADTTARRKALTSASGDRYNNRIKTSPDPPTNPTYDTNKNVISLDLSKTDVLTEPFKPTEDIAKDLLELLGNHVIEKLVKKDQYRPPNAELEVRDFNSEPFDMSSAKKNSGGVYHIGEDKVGRAAVFKDTYNTRYIGREIARIITNFHRYDTELLDDLKELFVLIRKKITINDEDLKSYSGMKSYQDITELNPFLPILLDDIIKYGNMKRGINKAMVLNIGEIATEKNLRDSGIDFFLSNPMEMLQGKELDVWKRGIDSIKTQGAVMVKLLTKLIGKDPKECTWDNLMNISSWGPNLGGLLELPIEPSRGDNTNNMDGNNVDVTASTDDTMEDNEVLDSIKSIIEQHIDDPKTLFDEISNLLEVDLVPSISELPANVDEAMEHIQQMLNNIGDDNNDNIRAGDSSYILIVTVYFYYRLTGKTDWFLDPLGKSAEGWSRDFDATRQKAGLKLIEESIKKLKEGDEQDNRLNVIRYLFFDTNTIIFNDLKGAETFIVEDMGFQPLGDSEGDDNGGFEHLYLKVFWYW